jgi:ubiquinone biosynthesis UbiH/UbiF/VisC/COQ6 family hydroxylase
MHFDLLIVGGGLAGLSLAAALRETRLKIALVENRAPTPAIGWDARVYAITPANAEFLDAIGAWKHLAHERIAPIHAMKVVGDTGGRIDFSAYEAGVDELGWIVESSLVACELWESVKRQANLTLLCPASPRAVERDEKALTLTLAGGERLSTRLIVGADGRESWVRAACGLTATSRAYGEMGVVANFECALPHRGVARQWFRDDGVLAWLPLAGGDGVHRFSIVWSTPTGDAEALLELAPEELCARVREAGNDELGELKLITRPAAFPLYLMRVPNTVAPRVALVGDAAHALHPLSGHGINLGFEDARALAGLIAATPEWQDIGAERLLKRYQRARREETLVLQTATDALRKLFRETLPGVKALRNAGLALSNAAPVVKNALVRYALGAF